MSDEGGREAARLATLEHLDAVRTETDEILRKLVDDVREVFGAELCMVNLVLADSLYFRAWSGDLPADLLEKRQAPLEGEMCAYTVEIERPLIVSDMLATEKFADHGLYERRGIRFYAGVPLVTSDGVPIGTLCVLDTRSRELGEDQMLLLETFARAVVERLELLGALRRERGAKEEEVRRSRELQLVLDNSWDMITTIGLDGLFKTMNPASKRILGYEPAELIGRDPVELIHPKDRERTLKLSATIRDGESVIGFQNRHLRKDGGVVWIEWNATFWPEEGVTYCVARDITARKQTEEALRESEERYRRLVENSPDAIIVHSEGKFVYVNAAWVDLLGAAGPEDFLGKPVMDVVHPDYRELVRERIERVQEKGGFAELVEEKFITLDGRVIDVEIAGLPFTYEGRPAVQAVVRDITDRKRVERSLRESEHRFHQLFEQSVDALLVHDETGRMVDCNPEACRSLVYSREELLALSVKDFATNLLSDEEKRSKEGRTIWQRAMAGEPGKVMGIHFGEHRRKDGTTFPVEVHVGGVDYGGERMIFASARDITGRKQAEEEIKRLSHQNELILNSAGEGIFGLNLRGEVEFANPAAAAMLGYEVEELIGGRQHDTIHHSHPDGTPYPVEDCPIYAALRDGEVHWASDEVFWRKDGTSFPVEYVSTPIREDGEVIGAVGAFSDITERKQAEKALRDSEERFRALVRHASGVIVIPAADGTVRYVSPSVERVLGYQTEEIIGTSVSDYVHPDDVERVRILDARARNNPGVTSPVEFRVRHADGSWRYLEVIGNNLLDESSVRGMVFNGRDVTERKVLEEQLIHQAFHDTLTGLPNRALLEDRLGHALVRADRRGEPVAVLFMDLDNFKVVNDSLGHEVGNQLLVAVAERLRARLRPEDTVARLSGDEFAVLLEEITDESEATHAAEQIAEELRAPFALGDHEVTATTSIGVVTSTPGVDRPEDLLRDADVAMHEAKNRGKAQYRVFSAGMHARALERLKLETELRRAIERGEFRVYYQPTVRLTTDLQRRLRSAGNPAILAPRVADMPSVAGMEALLRWEHPERGLMFSSEFIPLAEETGLILPIGRWVIGEACKQAREWQERYPSSPPLSMCVNLSARQFQSPDLAQSIGQALRETGLDPSGLILEITESVVMEEVRSTIDALEELKGLGVRVAIDDFGTGYSSLSYIKRFPVDFLKIDRSFINGLGKHYEDRVLVSAIVRLAHTLGLKVIAEGVETAEQLARLREMECDLAQGYYFSEPLPGEAAGALLAVKPGRDT